MLHMVARLHGACGRTRSAGAKEGKSLGIPSFYWGFFIFTYNTTKLLGFKEEILNPGSRTSRGFVGDSFALLLPDLTMLLT